MWKLSLLFCSLVVAALLPNKDRLLPSAPEEVVVKTDATEQPRIQLVLLLDTSGSMQGLIEQAKAQLWKMVNLLAFSQKNGQTPIVDIALYEYGNTANDAKRGWVRQVVPMGNDLDLVSQKLFDLRIDGGEEYCAWAINEALDSLPWTSTPGDLRVVIIAGNEPFNQGPVEVKPVCDKAASKYIVVNAIFCGDYEEGIRTGWRDCPSSTNGQYMNINTNAKVVHVPTPYDDRIIELNSRLNDTYIGYGLDGLERKDLQMKQEANSDKFGSGNMRSRAKSKTSKSYDNSSWDVVDANTADSTFIIKAKAEDLPEPMRKLDAKQRTAYVDSLTSARALIQRQITALNDSATVYIAKLKPADAEENSLDKVMTDALRKQALQNGYLIKE